MHVAISKMFVAGDGFLDASTHLYKRVCPSVRGSVSPSVRWSHVFFSGGKWDFNESWTSPTLQISSGMNNNTVAPPLSPPPPPKPQPRCRSHKKVKTCKYNYHFQDLDVSSTIINFAIAITVVVSCVNNSL